MRAWRTFIKLDCVLISSARRAYKIDQKPNKINFVRLIAYYYVKGTWQQAARKLTVIEKGRREIANIVICMVYETSAGKLVPPSADARGELGRRVRRPCPISHRKFPYSPPNCMWVYVTELYYPKPMKERGLDIRCHVQPRIS